MERRSWKGKEEMDGGGRKVEKMERGESRRDLVVQGDGGGGGGGWARKKRVGGSEGTSVNPNVCQFQVAPGAAGGSRPTSSFLLSFSSV